MLLSDRHGARAALLVNDGGRHHHVQVAGLGDHGVGVDLAHVVALVLGLDIPDGEGPGVVAVVDDVEARDAGDDVATDGEDHLAVDVHPGHLVIQQVGHHALERGLPPQRHRRVADVLCDPRAGPAVNCSTTEANEI